MIYAAPGAEGAKIAYKAKYDNFIGGKWVAPVKGEYFKVVTPINGESYTMAARSTAEDIELAIDAAHAAFPTWGKTSPTERSNILLKIADRLEANLELLAYAETVDNGKAIRETLNADIPLTVDHFRYFAGCLRAQEGGMSSVDGQLDVLGGGAGGHGVGLAVDRGDDLEILALDRGNPLAADEVVVFGLVGNLGAISAGGSIDHFVS